jgi:ADP-heptose:LPS heptosyltransferase
MRQLIKNIFKGSLRYLNYASWKIYSPNKISSIDYKKSDKILIVNLGFIGDLLATTPLISKLKNDGKKVDLLILDSMKEVFEGNKKVNRVISVKDENKIRINQNYDLILLVHPNSIILDRKGKIVSDSPVGFDVLKQRNGLKRPFFNESHKVLQNLEFLNLLKGQKQEFNPINSPMELFLTKNEIEKAKKKFDLNEPFVVLSIGSRGQKRIGVKFPKSEKFIAVSNYFTNLGYKVVIVGTRDQYEECSKISNTGKKGEIINLAGKTSLRELFSIIELSDFVFAVDSGSIHIAAALKKRIIDIIRAHQRKIWSPWTVKECKVLYAKGNNLDSITLKEMIEAARKFS